MSRNARFHVRGPPLAPSSREIALATRSYIVFWGVSVRNPPAEAVGAKLGRPRLLEFPARTAGVSIEMLGFTFASRRLRRNLGQALSERVLLSYFRAVRVRNPPVEAVSAKLGRPELLELPARTAGVSRNARLLRSRAAAPRTRSYILCWAVGVRQSHVLHPKYRSKSRILHGEAAFTATSSLKSASSKARSSMDSAVLRARSFIEMPL